jgi:hypothetical protein
MASAARRARPAWSSCDRRPEERHDAVPQELVDRPLVAVDGGQDHLEGAVRDGVDLTTATTTYRELDMRFWLEQAEAETTALG